MVSASDAKEPSESPGCSTLQQQALDSGLAVRLHIWYSQPDSASSQGDLYWHTLRFPQRLASTHAVELRGTGTHRARLRQAVPQQGLTVWSDAVSGISFLAELHSEIMGHGSRTEWM